MRLLSILAISFVFAGCLNSKSVNPLLERTYIDPEYKCKIWMNFHSDCVKEIKNSENKKQVQDREDYARDVRKSWVEDIDYAAISPDRKLFYLEQVSIARGEAILAASIKEEELGN